MSDQPKRIFLVGLMGVGKSTVGPALAARLVAAMGGGASTARPTSSFRLPRECR